MYEFSTPIRSVSGIGEIRAKHFHDLGIETVKDLLFDAPFRYETVQSQQSIAFLKPNTTVCIHAQVLSKLPIKTGRFKSMIKAKIMDETGRLDVTWFNMPFVLSALRINDWYYFMGKVTEYKGKITFTNPTFEQHPPQFGPMLPIYHESENVTSRQIRKIISQVLENITITEDPHMLPMYEREHLIPLQQALSTIHSPGKETDPTQMLTQAKQRLAFDELFFIIKEVLERRLKHQRSKPNAKLVVTNTDIKEFTSLLPYTLSPSQLEALQAVSLDLVQAHPMQRLLQGEVGSGKTTVAAFALWIAAQQAFPAYFICPTNILAQQHFDTLTSIFKNSPITIGLFTGKEKHTECDIYVGTHALFQTKKAPSLVVIDEEHRFGVGQRDTFFQKAKKPHYMSMTATPIPRTVALTVLADYDVSYIKPHRNKENRKTWVVPLNKRERAYTWIHENLHETKGQALIVCPFIETSTIETLQSVKSATTEVKNLQHYFEKEKLSLLHGRMKEEQKQKIFQEMMKGNIDILVTTPVVEVGVDLPKATIIVIEGAERFGLAQLHQLRGRVGRRGQDSYCLLFTSQENQFDQKRLEYFCSTYDGNSLAEYDFHHRGSGEILGLRQHGFFDLQFAQWSDHELIERCKREAQSYIS